MKYLLNEIFGELKFEKNMSGSYRTNIKRFGVCIETIDTFDIDKMIKYLIYIKGKYNWYIKEQAETILSEISYKYNAWKQEESEIERCIEQLQKKFSK